MKYSCAELKELKRQLRKSVNDKISSFAQVFDLAEVSVPIWSSVAATEVYADCDFLFAYIPSANEADCIPLIQKALSDGKKVLVPRVIRGTSLMDFYFLDESLPLDNQLEKGSYGLREPLTSLRKYQPSESACKHLSALMIVPGVAFSRNCQRLGHGKGFYDLYIPLLKKSFSRLVLAGFCLSVQLADEIPCDEHDVSMDMVFTENETLALNKTSSSASD